MSAKLIALLWASVGLIIAVTLVMAARHIGRGRAAGWLVVVGLFMLALEEPLLTWFWGWSGPRADRDGMAGLVTASARAHVLDTAFFGSAWFVLLGWIALTRFRRGERWAVRVLLVGWVVVAVAIVVSSLAVYSRGVPVPTAGGDAEGPGYGWEQLAVGLLAWGGGLWLMRSSRRIPESVPGQQSPGRQ